MDSLILIVDDEPITRYILRTLLEFDGYTVAEAENGYEALELVNQDRPALMILDVMMPDMDGIEVCKHLRNQPDTADLPIIMLSSKTDPTAVEDGLIAGADRYLCKPMDHQDLKQSIKEVLDGPYSDLFLVKTRVMQ